MLFCDKVNIITSVIDDNNVPTEVFTAPVKAYIEDNSKEVRTSNGSTIKPDFFIMLPSSTEILNSDVLEIVKIHGQDPMGNEVGQKQIKAIRRIGGFSMSHLEVYV